MKYLVSIVLIIVALNATAQQFKNNVGAPYLGLSAYSSQKSVMAMHSNIAAVGNLKSSGAGVFAERRFGLADLNNINAVGAIATKAGGIGISVNRYGFADFNESQIGVGYGRALSNKLSVGAKINYYNQRITQYGTASLVNAEAALLLHLTPKLTSGVSVYNPVGSKYGITNDEKLGAIYKFGMGYDVSDKVAISGELVKREDEALSFTGMVHYQFEKKFYAKAGISSAANSFFASAGINLAQKFRVELATSYHQQLGFTPAIVLVVE